MQKRAFLFSFRRYVCAAAVLFAAALPPQAASIPSAKPKEVGLSAERLDQLGRNGEPGSVGAFGWGGAYHTVCWVDPAEQLVAVLMARLPAAGASDLHGKFRTLVYQSIIDSYEKRRQNF
jgi:CubicO group peptidase (beta-lactamase class C family)